MIDLLSMSTIVSIYLCSVRLGASLLHVSSIVEFHSTKLATCGGRWLPVFYAVIDEGELNWGLSTEVEGVID